MTINLMHGDCLELMKTLPDKSIDMILCDLPYGVTANKADIQIPFEPPVFGTAKGYGISDGGT